MKKKSQFKESCLASFRALLVAFFWQAVSFSGTASDAVPWTYDSISPAPPALSKEEAAARQVAQTLEYMLERWNAHDLDGYLNGYWNSALLVYIVDGQQLCGWQELHDSMLRGYADPRTMGLAVPGRVRVRLLTPEIAFAVTNWSLNFPSSNHVVVGVDTVYLQRFGSDWKVISNHTSTLEM